VYTPPEASCGSPQGSASYAASFPGSASSSSFAASPSALPWTPGRRYLDVPYAEKNDAKKKGAKWDAQARRWYAPAEVGINRFLRWWRPGTAAPPLAPPAAPRAAPPATPSPTAPPVAPPAAAAAAVKKETDQCVVLGARSREERDAELRRSAVDVEEATQPSQPGAQQELQREAPAAKRVKTECKPVAVAAAAASPAATTVAAAHAPPAAPPASPPGAGSSVKQLTVKQKVERIKEQLGLEAALPISTAVAAALESLGMSRGGSLATQIDALNSQLGLEE